MTAPAQPTAHQLYKPAMTDQQRAATAEAALKAADARNTLLLEDVLRMGNELQHADAALRAAQRELDDAYAISHEANRKRNEAVGARAKEANLRRQAVAERDEMLEKLKAAQEDAERLEWIFANVMYFPIESWRIGRMREMSREAIDEERARAGQRKEGE